MNWVSSCERLAVFWKVKYFEIEKLLPFPKDIFFPHRWKLSIPSPGSSVFACGFRAEQLVICLQRNLFVNSRLRSSRFFVGNFCIAKSEETAGGKFSLTVMFQLNGKGFRYISLVTIIPNFLVPSIWLVELPRFKWYKANYQSKSFVFFSTRFSIPPEKFYHYFQINWRTNVHMCGWKNFSTQQK